MFVYQVNQRKLHFFRYSQLLRSCSFVAVCTLPVTNKSVWKSVCKSWRSWGFQSASAFIKTMEQKYERIKFTKILKFFQNWNKNLSNLNFNFLLSQSFSCWIYSVACSMFGIIGRDSCSKTVVACSCRNCLKIYRNSSCTSGSYCVSNFL